MDRLESKEIEKPADESREEAVLPRDAYALLAQANLLRMRGHWEDAALSCMAALRLAPDSSSANSLLGDIYENQGRYEDAAQWYRMALDVNPDSPADRLKLDRLYRRNQAQRDEAQWEQSRISGDNVAPTARQPETHNAIHRLIRDPEIVLRYGAVVAAFGLVLVIACAFTVVHHAGRLNTLGLGGDAVVKSVPVIVPPLAGVLPSDPDGTPARDPSEQSLLTILQSARELTAEGIAVTDVQVDPRLSLMTVTFGLPASQKLTQVQIAHEALRVLQAAAASSSSPGTFTARCLLVSDPSNAAANKVSALAFIGDVSRDGIRSSTTAGGGLTDLQAEAAFTNVWWSSTADIRS